MFATIAPLNRVLSVKSPKGGPVYYGYGTNTVTTGTVKIWTVEGGVLKNNNGGTYVEGELYRTKTTDASGKTTEGYKDKLGQVILKIAGGTAKTYYVYDDFGLLRYVLSPEATEVMNGTTYSPASAEVKGLCYYYEYDGRKRMIKKQLPGAKEVLMVYDARDRLVLVQDGKTRQEDNSKWLYTLYDGFNRPVQTGWLNTTKTFAQAQTDFGTVSDLGTTGGLPAGYTATAGGVLTKTHYDNYTGCPVIAPASGYMATPKGQVTWGEAKVLGTGSFVVTASYYDDKYRVVQQSTDGPDIDLTTTNTYDFVGNLTQSIEAYTGQVNATITKDFTYDHAGRLEKVEQEIEGDGDNGKVVLAENHYNELGQLMLKKLHSANDTSFVQDIDYIYDVRGWLKSINNFEDTTANKLYAQSLGYMKNGNIANMNWRNTILNDEGWVEPVNKRSYTFGYDALSRLTGAGYSDTDGQTGLFNASFEYDLNGNITGLQRWGNTAMDGGPVVAGLIDDMVYTYFDNSNQIKSVADNTTSFVGHNLHFTEGSGDFAYDHNGSATYLPHKGAAIGYNYLALPESIDITGEGVIGYTYSATGVKLVKSFGAAKTYYQGNAENMAGTEVLYHPEGRAVKTAGGWAYEYNLTDHLGNTRASFAIDTVYPVILQQKNYYPFGLEQATWNDMDANATRRLFGGKELQDEGELMTYDFGARQLDVEMGRWLTVDPLAEDYYQWSPYNYTFNNPILLIDPDGMAPDGIDDILEYLNQKQGYQVAINNETQQITIFKTTAALSKDVISTNSEMNIVVTENVYQLSSSGDVQDISVTETAVSATLEAGEVTGASSENIGYSGSDSQNIDDMKASYTDNDPIVKGVGELAKSNNRGALFSQDNSLPGLSTQDRIEKNIIPIVQGIGIRVKRETSGLESVNTDISRKTLLNVKLDRAQSAGQKFKKIARKSPVNHL